MFHLDNSSGIGVMPELKQALSRQPQWFTEGDTQTPPSYPGADWFNIVQAELLNVLKEAEIEPNKAELNQLSRAVRAIVGADAVPKKRKINGKKLDADITLGAKDVGALSKHDFNARLGGSGFEIMPSGVIRQWATITLPAIGKYNPMKIGETMFYTHYHRIVLPITFPHCSDSVNVTFACGTMDAQVPVAGMSVTANLHSSPSCLTVAVTSPILGYVPTIHYEIIGH